MSRLLIHLHAPSLSLSLAQTTSADPSRGLLSQLTRVQNGVVSVCAEGATSLSWPIRLRPNQLPGAGGRVFPELAFLSRRPHSTRWAAASKPPPPPLLPLSPLRLPVSPRVDSYVKCCLGVFRVVFLRCCVLRVARNRFLRVYVQILNEARWTSRQPPISRAKAILAAPQPLSAACFTFSSRSHTITRPLGTPFVI